MATSYHIKVRYEATTPPRLIIELDDLVLAPDTSPIHSGVWDFEGIDERVAEGWCPSIKFDLDQDPQQYSGPFTNLCATHAAVLGCGLNGARSKYAYRAVLEPPIGSGGAIFSEKAWLDSRQIAEAKAAVIRVSLDPTTEGLLRVEPEEVTLVDGQSILWEVVEAPQDIPQWYPRLAFSTAPPAPAGTNSHFGPFASLDVRDNTVLGSAYRSEEGPYGYRFQMVSVEDETVLFESSPDPTIDKEGDPSEGGDIEPGG